MGADSEGVRKESVTADFAGVKVLSFDGDPEFGDFQAIIPKWDILKRGAEGFGGNRSPKTIGDVTEALQWVSREKCSEPEKYVRGDENFVNVVGLNEFETRAWNSEGYGTPKVKANCSIPTLCAGAKKGPPTILRLCQLPYPDLMAVPSA